MGLKRPINLFAKMCSLHINSLQIGTLPTNLHSVCGKVKSKLLLLGHFTKHRLEEVNKAGFLQLDDQNIRATAAGRLRLNAVLSELL